jgi:uncharacterized tellurite resistance protein B-like protein
MIDPLLTDEHNRKSIIALLVKLQIADGQSTEHEYVYIQKVAWSLGLSNSDVEEVIHNLHLYREALAPKTEKERMTILYYLLFFMLVDQKVSMEEEKLVQEFAFRLGFRTALTTDLVQVIKDHATSHLPAEKMLQAIKKYLN